MSNKVVALVTGCSKGGIGYALCEELASKGCIVYATARRMESMDGLDNHNVHRLLLDVTQDDSVQEVVRLVIENEGQVDILFNNAGMSTTGAVIDVDMQEIMTVFDTNVFSIIRMARAVIPHMASRKSGTIVNIGSIGGEVPIPWGGPYCSSKAAVHSITDVLYMECTPLNIDVVLVSAGGVKSRLAQNQENRIHIPQNSLYTGYVDSILAKLRVSQPTAMPTATFAQKVVSSVLVARPPRYITLASLSTTWRFFQWLPRGWVLRYLWRLLGEGPRTKKPSPLQT